jgi:hypothetical protein
MPPPHPLTRKTVPLRLNAERSAPGNSLSERREMILQGIPDPGRFHAVVLVADGIPQNSN